CARHAGRGSERRWDAEPWGANGEAGGTFHPRPDHAFVKLGQVMARSGLGGCLFRLFHRAGPTGIPRRHIARTRSRLYKKLKICTDTSSPTRAYTHYSSRFKPVRPSNAFVRDRDENGWRRSVADNGILSGFPSSDRAEAGPEGGGRLEAGPLARRPADRFRQEDAGRPLPA